MRSNEELSNLFTTYFSDRLSPLEIDSLVADTLIAVHNRRMRTYAVDEDTRTSTIPSWGSPTEGAD